MSRSIRVEYDGAVYHVMARGNEMKAIFYDDIDREVFLDTLALKIKRLQLLVKEIERL